jgi:fructose-1,6-bisphosphatase/inositol monophosphatase family enzyme
MAEQALAALLRDLLPGSAVIGEEAVAADPGSLEALVGVEPVWIVDPIDGTGNFVAGSARFSTLVALACRNQLLASWTYVPVSGDMATARHGAGAFFNGEPLQVRELQGGLQHLQVMTPAPTWWIPEHRELINKLSHAPVSISYFDTSGLEYIELAGGRRDAIVVTWENVWDHAAGLLLVAEAGGVATTRDGSPFRLAGGNRLPFVVAPDHATAAALHKALGSPGNETPITVI